MLSRGDNAKLVLGNPGGHKTLPYIMVVRIVASQRRSPEDLSRVSRVLQLPAILAIVVSTCPALKYRADKPKPLRG